MKHSLQDIAKHLEAKLLNPVDIIITGLNYADQAKENELTLINKIEHVTLLSSSKASAALITSDLEDKAKEINDKPIMIVQNADLAMAKVLELFSQPNSEKDGIHPRAVIEPTAKIGNNVSIGAGSYIGRNVTIGDGTIIYANASIYDNAKIGPQCIIWPNVNIRERTEIGAFCRLYSGCNIGSDGFGYRPSEDGKSIVRVPHIGNVVLGNYVDVGSGACIDNAKFGSTKIGDMTKIDNLVQIGHNVIIGQGCMICGQVGIAGSVNIGNGVIIAGNAGIRDHVTIGDNAQVGGKAGVMKDVKPGERVMGYPAYEGRKLARQWAAVRHLPETMKKLKALAKTLNIDL